LTLHDDLFPTDVSYGSVGGPGFYTNLITTDSGVDEAVARWSRPRRSYDVSYGIKNYTQLQTVRNHYNARLGCQNTFPYKDPLDFSTNTAATPKHYTNSAAVPPSNADALLGVGDGTTTTFQLRKPYASGSQTVYAPIAIVKTGTTVVSLDLVNQASGWSVNLLTGLITFTSPPGAGVVVRAGCEFYIKLRYGKDVDRVLPLRCDDFSTGSLPSIPLIEDIDGSTIDEDRLPMGGGRKAFSASISIAQSEGVSWELVPASSGLTVTVEAAADMPSGGPHYALYNAGADSLTLKGSATTIGTLAAGAYVRLDIWKVGGSKTWKGMYV